MVKTIARIGNSQGLILDAALLELARLKPGDQVNVEVHDGGTITVTPVRSAIGPDQAAKSARGLIRRNAGLFKRLA
jgi:antitoxin component of MazEF toxin-antitoxin module